MQIALGLPCSGDVWALGISHKVAPRVDVGNLVCATGPARSDASSIVKYNSGVYYEACTKHFPVLLRTTKLAQSTSQYYFVLQSLRKVLPSTTSARPSTTSYYKMCTKYVLVLLPAAKLAQRQFYIEKLYTRRAFNHNRFYTETLFTQRPVCPACWGVSESCASTRACSSPKIYFRSAHSPKERDQLKPFYKKERNASAAFMQQLPCDLHRFSKSSHLSRSLQYCPKSPLP